MNVTQEKNKYNKQTVKRQIRSMLKGLLLGSLTILAVGTLAYVLLFVLMLIM